MTRCDGRRAARAIIDRARLGERIAVARIASMALTLGAGLMVSSAARGDAAPDRWRSRSYYAIQGAVAAALIGGEAATGLVREQLETGGDTVWFPGDAGLRGRCSPEAAQLSDVSLALAVATPIGVQLGGGLGARFANAEIVYTQALLANWLITSISKDIFRRPRPFSYRKDRDCAFQVEESDDNRSFFSGHASGSFTAAFAGASLLSESGLDTRTRAALWGAQMALAGATANLRARAGKHYYSDIVVGAFVGAGVGLGIPVLHGGDAPISGSDLAAGAVGLVMGVLGSQWVAVGAEAIDEGALTGVTLSPLPLAHTHGILATGHW